MISTAPTTDSHTYRVSKAGRRVTTVLLLGVVAIALFALWTIVTLLDQGLSGPEWVTAALMLGLIGLAPFVGWNLLEERAAAITTNSSGITFKSLGGIELHYPWSQVRGLRSEAERKSRIAAFLFDEEDGPNKEKAPASGSIEVASDVSILLPAKSNEEATARVVAIEGSNKPSKGAADDDDEIGPDEDDRDTLEVVVGEPGLERIANPVVRALHKAAHGRFVPIYPGVEDRAGLLAEIASRSAGT